MSEKEIFGLVIALVAANWSALATAIKCRDKIDASRNLLWGISGNNPPKSKEMIRFIMKSDITGFLVALVWIFLAVGLILVVAAYYLLDTDVPQMVTGLYGVTGSLLILMGIAIGILGWIDRSKIEKWALDRLEGSQP